MCDLMHFVFYRIIGIDVCVIISGGSWLGWLGLGSVGVRGRGRDRIGWGGFFLVKCHYCTVYWSLFREFGAAVL